jgi:hypothetical protein
MEPTTISEMISGLLSLEKGQTIDLDLTGNGNVHHFEKRYNCYLVNKGDERSWPDCVHEGAEEGYLTMLQNFYARTQKSA